MYKNHTNMSARRPGNSSDDLLENNIRQLHCLSNLYIQVGCAQSADPFLIIVMMGWSFALDHRKSCPGSSQMWTILAPNHAKLEQNGTQIEPKSTKMTSRRSKWTLYGTPCVTWGAQSGPRGPQADKEWVWGVHFGFLFGTKFEPKCCQTRSLKMLVKKLQL